MEWSVEYSNEFGAWWSELKWSEQADVAAVCDLLADLGPRLPYPYSSAVEASRRNWTGEPRVQSSGRPIRVFNALDPRRSAIPLIGGDNTGDDRFYARYVPLGAGLYDEYLAKLTGEGSIR